MAKKKDNPFNKVLVELGKTLQLLNKAKNLNLTDEYEMDEIQKELDQLEENFKQFKAINKALYTGMGLSNEDLREFYKNPKKLSKQDTKNFKRLASYERDTKLLKKTLDMIIEAVEKKEQATREGPAKQKKDVTKEMQEKRKLRRFKKRGDWKKL